MSESSSVNKETAKSSWGGLWTGLVTRVVQTLPVFRTRSDEEEKTREGDRRDRDDDHVSSIDGSKCESQSPDKHEKPTSPSDPTNDDLESTSTTISSRQSDRIEESSSSSSSSVVVGGEEANQTTSERRIELEDRKAETQAPDAAKTSVSSFHDDMRNKRKSPLDENDSDVDEDGYGNFETRKRQKPNQSKRHKTVKPYAARDGHSSRPKEPLPSTDAKDSAQSSWTGSNCESTSSENDSVTYSITPVGGDVPKPTSQHAEPQGNTHSDRETTVIRMGEHQSTVDHVSVSDRLLSQQTIMNTVAMVCSSLRNGPWPSLVRTLDPRMSVTGIGDTLQARNLHLEHMSIVSASLDQFCRDVVIPSFLGDEGHTRPRSQPLNQKRLFLGTLLLLREVMVQNAESIFGQSALLTGREPDFGADHSAGNDHNFDSGDQGETSLFSAKVLVTSVILAGLMESNTVESEDVRMDSSICDEFLAVVQDYDSGEDDFLPSPVDEHATPYLSSGAEFSDDEKIAWIIHHNAQCDQHELVLESCRRNFKFVDNGFEARDKSFISTNAAHITILERSEG